MRSVLLVMLSLAFVLSGCDEDLACTEEFVTIGVKVTGGPLTEYFTLRNATGDTMTTSASVDSTWYPILDDSFQFFLAETQEYFQFRGVVNDSLVIDQQYLLGADKCHVMRIEGPTQIDL